MLTSRVCMVDKDDIKWEQTKFILDEMGLDEVGPTLCNIISCYSVLTWYQIPVKHNHQFWIYLVGKARIGSMLYQFLDNL